MKRRAIAMVVGAATASLLAGCGAARPEPTLSEVYDLLQTKEMVDLTHSFAPGIPHWPGFPDSTRQTLYWYTEGVGSLGSGFFAELYCHVGQWGTHVDPPAHFVQGLRTLDQIPPREMIMPLVVLDIHEAAAKDPDATVTMEDVSAWEKRHGPVPKGAFVALRSDWSRRWPDPVAMRNADADGVAHYPGWSLEVLRYLYETRAITASGHETTDTDPGVAASAGDFSLESYVLGRDRYQVELLANLDRVPEAGALVVVSFPKPTGGSGFPARVFAILP